MLLPEPTIILNSPSMVESAFPSASGCFVVILLLQIILLTSGFGMQINVQVPDRSGFVVQCSSGGWLPQARMEWRDSRGNIIPHSSKSYPQDIGGLWNLGVLLKNSTHGPITCCFYNPITDQEKRASIILPDMVFKSEYMLMMSDVSCPLMYLIIMHALLFFQVNIITSKKDLQHKLCILVFECIPFLLLIVIFPVYWKFKNAVSASDDLLLMYNSWMDDIRMILITLMLFFTILISALFYSLRGFIHAETPTSLNPRMLGEQEAEDNDIRLSMLGEQEAEDNDLRIRTPGEQEAGDSDVKL